MPDMSRPPAAPLRPLSFDGPLGRQIVELHIWVVGEGLRGAAAAELFDGFCQRLVSAGGPLWRGFIGMPTLHPQWGGYRHTWRRDLNAIEPAHFRRFSRFPAISRFGQIICQATSERSAAGKPIAVVDLALHVGEVLYGNVGAVDRLDFTVIGPAVNEVARIETLCEPLGRKVLVSAELASAVGDRRRLEPLGYHKLRGVRDPREIYGLDLGFRK